MIKDKEFNPKRSLERFGEFAKAVVSLRILLLCNGTF